jgi:hypothetical protein
MYMYMYVCNYVCIWLSVVTYTCIHTHIYMLLTSFILSTSASLLCIHAYTHTYINTTHLSHLEHFCLSPLLIFILWACMSASNRIVHACMHTDMDTHAYKHTIRMHIQVRVCMYVCIYIYIHIHTYIHKIDIQM